MAGIKTVSLIFFLSTLALLASILYEPITRRMEVFGINRPLHKIHNIHGEDLKIIPDTIYCEDLHYHEPSGLLFGAAETDKVARKKWFPP